MLLSNILLQAQIAADTIAAAGEQIQQGEIRLSIWDLAVHGGWIMIVLAIFSIIAIYIFIERFIVINKAAKSDTSFMNTIRNYMLEGKLDSAITLCRNNDSPIANMIEKGLTRIGKPLNDINAAIENVGNLEVSKLEKGVAIIAMISSTSPMIGFLGTVTGMIRAFYDMSMAGNNIEIATLSSGIYTAMVTTVGGLIVGIVAYILHAILTSRIEKVVYVLEANATEFMDVLNEPAR